LMRDRLGAVLGAAYGAPRSPLPRRPALKPAGYCPAMSVLKAGSTSAQSRLAAVMLPTETACQADASPMLQLQR